MESSTKSQELPTSIVSKPSDEIECHGSKPLSVTAPVFVPSAGSATLYGVGTTDAAVEGSGSTMQRPPPFDGKSTWEAYRSQFTLLAELNGWTEQQKAAYLAISLRGPALTVLTNLPEEQHRDYAALSAALQNHFGNTRQAELN